MSKILFVSVLPGNGIIYLHVMIIFAVLQLLSDFFIYHQDLNKL